MSGKDYYYPEETIIRDRGYDELLDSDPTFPCTLLIPNEIYELVEKQLSSGFSGSFSIFFREVMRFHYVEAFQDWFPQSRSVRTRYQERVAGKGEREKSGYRRVNFRANSWGWGILSSLSVGSGLSRCLVFVLLLRVVLGLSEIVPTKIERETWRKHSITIFCSRSLSTETGKYSRTLRYLRKKHAAYNFEEKFREQGYF